MHPQQYAPRRPSRPRQGSSQSSPQEPYPLEPNQLQDIVLLEENDLYRYHRQQDHEHHHHRLVQQDHEHHHHRLVQQDRWHPSHPSHRYEQGTPPSSRNRSLAPMDAPDASEFQTSNSLGLPPSRKTAITSTSSHREGSQLGTYVSHTTPYSQRRKPSGSRVGGAVPITHGAFRPGGSVNLFSRDYIGLPLNFFIVGFFNGGVSALITPIFMLFKYDTYRANSAGALLNSPWYFKFFFGFLSDCFPVNRYRRKPYIYGGWLTFTVFLSAMAIMEDVVVDQEDGKGGFTVATSEAARYIVPLMVGGFGRMVVSVGIEGMMIELAQREGEFIRGRSQCFLFIFRFVGEAVGTMAVALAFNGPEYEGSFAASVSMRVMFALFAGVSFAGIVVTKFFLREEQVTTSGQKFKTHARRVWNIIQRPTTWQLMCFGFLVKGAYQYKVHEDRAIYTKWLGTTPLAFNLVDAANPVGSVVGAFLLSRYWLNTNWRKIIFWSCLASLVISVPADMVTIWDAYRDDAFYLTKKQLVGIFESSLWLLRLVIIIEIADPGYEMTTYGLITTVYNLATPVVSTIRNLVASTFTKDEMDLAADTHTVRMHVTTEFLCKYGLRLVVLLLALPLIPRQKRHAQERKIRGNPNMVVPVLLFTLFAGLFVAAFTASLLALFQSTSCLKFAGGGGC